MSDTPIPGVGPSPKLDGAPKDLPVTGPLSGLRDASRGLRGAVLPQARAIVLVTTGVLAAALAVLTYRYERTFTNVALDERAIGLVVCFTGLLASAFALVSRRLYASIALACGVMVLLTIVSLLKYRWVRATLYASDFVAFASLSDVHSFRALFPTLLVQGLAAIAVGLVLAWLLFALDRSRSSRRRSAQALALSAAGLAGCYAWSWDRGKIDHYFGVYQVSSFVASIPEALGLSRRAGFLEAADRGGRIDSEPVARILPAASAKAPPTIVAILHESSFPTRIFPVHCGGQAPRPLYASSNGNRYDLRVETFNGATWMTEYGLLLGLSTYHLGPNRLWLGYGLENKIRDSLPLQLRRHGYESVALYPSPGDFVNTNRFYKSIGFDRFLDIADLNTQNEYERDRFYYAKAIEQIRAHRASGSSTPLFLFLWTMSPHAPYDEPVHPDIEPEPGSICGKDKRWAEYIRRLILSEDDLAWFHAALTSAFPDEPFMLMGFGDHHPYISEDFLEPNPSKPFTPLKDSIGYKTFFRITGIGYQPDWAAVPQGVDMPFLGNVMMQAARLPRSGFYNDRDKLMELCQGRYADCPQQDEILSFHDRLVKSGTIVNR